MAQLQYLLDQTVWHNNIQDYLIAIGIFISLWIIFKIFEGIVFNKIKKIALKSKTDLDDELVKVVDNIPTIFYGFISLYIALQFIVVHPIITKIINVLLVIFIIYWATKVISNLIEYGLYKVAKKRGATKTEKNTTYFALSLVSKIILWTIGLLLILSNLGVNITALSASLGIGGIAIALALQNILGDLLSSFSIYFDKPFEIGDYIVVGELKGNVKKIGLKTTRIQALQGEEIIISNHELTTTRIQNFKKMKKRRASFQVGITYDTSMPKTKKSLAIIKKVIKEIKMCELDRAHFKEFGESALIFEIVYYINSAEYSKYMDKQQEINFSIKKEFEKEGIEMAFPTQTIHLNRLN